MTKSRIQQLLESGKLGKAEANKLKSLIPEMESFLNELVSEEFINPSVSDDKVTYLKKFLGSQNQALLLTNTFTNIFDCSEEEKKKKMDLLDSVGFKRELQPRYWGATMVHALQVLGERLKLYLVAIIDFEKLGQEKPDKQSLGPLLDTLRNNMQEQRFLDRLTTRYRNAAAHYLYYFEEGNIHLCRRLYDPQPTVISLYELMKLIKDLNILCEGFLLISFDKLFPPGTLILHE